VIDTRVKKAVMDLWYDKWRATMVVLAIAIGIFAIGTIATGYSILSHEMNASYMGTNPPSAVLYMDHTDDNLIDTVKDTGPVSDVEARRMVTARIQTGPDQWRTIWLFVIDDYNDMRIAKIAPESGSWPPKKGEMLIERAAMPLINSSIGDDITVMTKNGDETKLCFAGTAYDPAQAPAVMEGRAYGYITADTLPDLGLSPELDQLLITVTNNTMDEEHIKSASYQVKSMIERDGYNVSRIEVPAPGKHPNAGQMSSLMFLFETFGVIAFILSLVLVVNMITGLLSGQVRQIGIMKALGSTSGQVAAIYLGGVLLLGLIATMIALPLSIVAGRALALMIGGMLNFDIASYDVAYWVYAVVAVIGLAMPLVVAAYPVYRGSRITIHQAINDYGIGSNVKPGLFDSLITKVSWLSRPIMLTIRNMFRRKGRLALTLLTLAIGGSMFIVAMTLSASMDATVDNALGARHYNAVITFAKDYPNDDIRSNFTDIPGVTGADKMISTTASLTDADGMDSNQFTLFAITPDTKLVTYPVLEGRWLQPEDSGVVVLNHMLVSDLEEHGDAKDLKPGDRIMLNIDGNRSTWLVAGIVREMMAPARAYVSYDDYASLSGRVGQANAAIVSTTRQSGLDNSAPLFTVHGMPVGGGGGGKVVDNTNTILPLIEHRTRDTGLNISQAASIDEMRTRMKEHLAVVAAFIMIMALMTLAVGMLGLASTMSINVMERRREIGVMRAVGATNRNLYLILAIEAGVIGLLSWIVSLAIAHPLSIAVGNIFGAIFFKSPLDIAFSPVGIIMWLALVLMLAPAASLLAAKKALKLPVHEVLAYE